jgi:CheY-like chemotaxis protein
MSAVGSTERVRLLLVDDDSLARKVCGRLLEKAFVVTCVESGEAALALLAGGERFDAMLTDYRMPSMTGIELLERVRVLAPHTRRVLMSAEDVFGLDAYFACGLLDAFLGKPFDLPRATAMLIPPPQA